MAFIADDAALTGEAPALRACLAALAPSRNLWPPDIALLAAPRAIDAAAKVAPAPTAATDADASVLAIVGSMYSSTNAAIMINKNPK